MAIIYNEYGDQKWIPQQEPTPGITFTTPNEEKRFLGTIQSTARAFVFFMEEKFTEEDYFYGLETNAEKLGISPQELHERAIDLLVAEREKQEASKIS